MFGQFMRFVVHDDLSRMVSCVTRDFRATQTLMQQLLKCLSTEHPPCMLPPRQEDDDDVYKREGKEESSDDFVYNHVHFLYPSHELLTDLSFVVSFCAQLDDPLLNNTNNFKKMKFLSYLSCFILEHNKHSNSAYIPLRSECLVLTKEKLTFVRENQVNFPIPHFVVFPPDCKQFEFKRSFQMEDLIQLIFYDEDPHILKMIFKNLNEEEYEEEDEIDVDISFNHFDGQVKSAVKKVKKEDRVLIHISNPQDVTSLVQMMQDLIPNITTTTLPSFDF